MSLLGKAKQLADLIETTRPVELPDDFDQIIGYRPRPLQAELNSRDRRFNMRVLHRRFGKTVMEVRKLCNHAHFCPFENGRYAYLAPTYSQAEDIAWVYLESYHQKFCDAAGLDARKWQDKSKLAVWFPTRKGSKARVRLYGVDSPKQRIRGLYLDGVVFDEWAWIPMSVWTEQVRPMLSDDVRQGVDELGRSNQWADFIFTPAGRNHAYTMFRKAQIWDRGLPVVEKTNEGVEEEVFRDDWSAALYKASETGIITARELRDARSDMTQAKYDQEYECSFDAAVEGAIFAEQIEELRSRGRIQRIPYNPLLPVNTAWDLGWDDATAIWFWQERGEEPAFIDYYEASGAPLTHYADILADKRYRYGYHLFPHDVAVHEIGSGKSRESILRELGIRVSIVPKVKVKSDAISAGQALLPRCAFDEVHCAEGLDRLALYRREYDEKNQVFRQNPLHDWASHGADAFMTAALGRRRVFRPDTDPHSRRTAEL